MATVPYPHHSPYPIRRHGPIYLHHQPPPIINQYPYPPPTQSRAVIVDPLPLPHSMQQPPPSHLRPPIPISPPLHQHPISPPLHRQPISLPQMSPHKKRKLNHNTHAINIHNTQIEHINNLESQLDEKIKENQELLYKISKLQQELNQIITRNKYSETLMNELECKNKSLLNTKRQLETQMKSSKTAYEQTIKTLKYDIDAMKENKTNHIKIIKDQLHIINNKNNEIKNLKHAFTMKNDEILQLNTKYKKMKVVSAKLYLECVNGEEPRWDLINIETSNDGIIRDKPLSILRQQITQLYPNGFYNVSGIGKWKNDIIIEQSVKEFVELNGEYCKKSGVILRDDVRNTKIVRNMCDVIEKFRIEHNPRIPALIGQYGIRALMDIPKYTICAQYFGGEISTIAFAKVFEGTAVEHDHNVYALDQGIEKEDLKKIYKYNSNIIDINDEDKWNKTFVVDPFIVDGWNNGCELLVPYINDCRANIDNMEPTDNDNLYYNVEFVGVKINGWTETYLITKRDIKKGEELNTYYGEIFGLAVKKQIQNKEAKLTKKIRIDKEVLQELQSEFSGTFRLCKFT